MGFTLPEYHAPSFEEPFLKAAPNLKTASVETDGVAPSGYHAMSIFPEYFKIDGSWILPEESRMDCVAVLRERGEEPWVDIVEFRRLKRGDNVVLGRTEDGSDGIYVNTNPFEDVLAEGDAFAFRVGRSRETAYSRDYDELYELLRFEKEWGNIVWVLGPAVAFDHDSRVALSSLIDKGYVDALLAGNALATHDLEAALLGTALGQDIYTQENQPNGHYNHLDLLNLSRGHGSIEKLMENENIQDGIIYSAIKKKIPFVLAGSIRDDGPLPPVYGDVYEAQDAMRTLVRKATTVVALATQLHTIAAGNMTPSYIISGAKVRPVYFYSVDISEFAVNKLRDRGSLSATPIVANVQDFLVHLNNNMS
ncbi:hypothetical protein FACS1894187_15430 [Synergistales bacterium]|nr:hypothetical protein FACS1894187_15430 [Synergistales bacterium]